MIRGEDFLSAARLCLATRPLSGSGHEEPDALDQSNVPDVRVIER